MCHGDVFFDTIPNKETVEAFAEGESLLSDPLAKRFSSVDDLFEELNR